MKTEAVAIENKGKQVKSGDLSTGSGKNNTDFSQGPEEFTMTETPDAYYGQFLNRLNEGEIRANLTDNNIYEIKLKNEGGLVMPVVIKWTYADGSSEIDRLPAEIWRLNEYEIVKTFVKTKEVTNITIDPNLELADINLENNTFPKVEGKSKFDAFKEGKK